MGTYGEGTYGIKVYLSDPHEAVWISFRSKKYFKKRQQGVILTWAFESGHFAFDEGGDGGQHIDESKVREFGPTQIIPYIESSTPRNRYKEGNKNARIPFGKTFVYDGDHTAVAIKVFKRPYKKAVRVKIWFVDKSKKRPKSALSIQCNAKAGENVLLKDAYEVVKLEHDHPIKATLSACISKSCSEAQDYPLGIYVFPSFPYNLGFSKKPDPRAGSIYFQPFDVCEDSSACSSIRVKTKMYGSSSMESGESILRKNTLSDTGKTTKERRIIYSGLKSIFPGFLGPREGTSSQWRQTREHEPLSAFAKSGKYRNIGVCQQPAIKVRRGGKYFCART